MQIKLNGILKVIDIDKHLDKLFSLYNMLVKEDVSAA